MGFFFENLNSFSSGARLKSIWLVVEKIWNVSNISPNPAVDCRLLAAAGPSTLPEPGQPFVLVLLRSVLCSVFCSAAQLGKHPTFPTFPTAAALHPGHWCDQEAPDSAGWLWLVTINVFVVFADPPFR